MAGSPGSRSEVVAADQGLWCRRGDPPVMETMHRHNDIEINVVVRGELRYLHAGAPLIVREGRIAMFWATQPHGLVDSRPGDVCWVHVPLGTAMRWGLPEDAVAALLRVRPLVIEAPDLVARFAGMTSLWLEEIGDRTREEFALLEIRAALLRILQTETEHASPAGPSDGGRRGLTAERLQHVRTMAQVVMDGFTEELAVADVASAVHLAPSHAMTVFRQAVDVTIGEYLTMCRVAEAQRLLITSDLTTAEIASASGFGSLSSFYSHVTAACGMAPREYRRLGR
ncbi:helix-turn-helix domain-containing protein [Brachybacterium halotolerans subsp. kimchii]|uniref:helix-turn-helix domain-containing protein n=1 Tax=Brachybacterium halotolerans TaxID=2795215 RepID=UPI001E38B15D|nr:helix-turn-helix domain-containing protein [Brachybacterium halotolerans]UEJ81516.1 helix-turn-helix domain-containing protein [Brachybacterium halotolerans subsp. kimchii]